MGERSISSVFYTNVVAMMNPLFYNFKNKYVKTALRKTVSGIQFWLATASLCRLSKYQKILLSTIIILLFFLTLNNFFVYSS